MLVNLNYQQANLLFFQNERVKQDSSEIYQSFLSHGNFYKKSCLALICNEKAPQRKDNSFDIRLGDSINSSPFHHEKCEKKFNSFEHEILKYGNKKEKTWRCPYCYYWWPMGQKCQNPKCPTNQWPK